MVTQQVFVANPKKSKPVQDILLKNREKLLAFLPKFHDDRRGEIAAGWYYFIETYLTLRNGRG